MADDDFRATFLPRHDAAHAKFVEGDPEPWLELWSHREPVSLFGGFGYAKTGWAAVSAAAHKASARLAGSGDFRSDRTVTEVVGDIAYTVEIESCTRTADGGRPVPEKVRVTQIYRREDGGWKVVHRHGDIIRPDYTND